MKKEDFIKIGMKYGLDVFHTGEIVSLYQKDMTDVGDEVAEYVDSNSIVMIDDYDIREGKIVSFGYRFIDERKLDNKLKKLVKRYKECKLELKKQKMEKDFDMERI